MERSLKFAFKGIVTGIRWVSPHLLKFIIFLGKTMVVTVSAWWKGVPNAVENMAHHWVQEAARAGIPSEYESWIYYGAMVIAVILILVGWITASFVTVELFHWLIF